MAMLLSSNFPKELQGIVSAFQGAFQSDTRGTHLQDLHHFQEKGRFQLAFASQNSWSHLANMNTSMLPLIMMGGGVVVKDKQGASDMCS